jgi:hypothetical protein
LAQTFSRLVFKFDEHSLSILSCCSTILIIILQLIATSCCYFKLAWLRGVMDIFISFRKSCVPLNSLPLWHCRLL